jgi:hypothetical protein
VTEKEEAIAAIEQRIENEQREAGEKIAAYCVKIEAKENTIKKIEDDMEKIEGERENSQPKPTFEMNTALLDFIIPLLILRDTIHFSLMEAFFGEPFVKMNFYTAYKCIYQQQAKVKLIGDTLHSISIKVLGKWHKDLRQAFERINARAFTTPEGGRIHLEL